MAIAYSPLRYPGGKNCIFPFISDLLVKNGLTGCTYAEPYAGGAGLALRLLFEEYVGQIEINDLDPLIFQFWNAAIYNSEKVCAWLENTPATISTWRNCREIIQRPGEFQGFEVGMAAFFLNRTNVSGIIDGGVIGGFNQTGKYKIDARYNRTELIKRISKIGHYKSRIALSNIDGIKFIQELDRGRRDVFIYLDPPYVEKGARLYMNAYKLADHARLARFVSRLKKPWVMSYDNNDFVIKLYSGWAKTSYQLSHSTSNKIGSEIFVFSDAIDPDGALHLLDGVVAIP